MRQQIEIQKYRSCYELCAITHMHTIIPNGIDLIDLIIS